MKEISAIRRLIFVSVVTLTALVVFRLCFLDGLLRRVTIDGPSMAPAFCGAHYLVTCQDCRFRFLCDAEHLPTDNRAACPNCGYTDNSLDDAVFKSPDQVLIDRWPLLWKSPQRGDVVAIALPDSHDIAVKRIAGLPGEQLGIAAGDLFAGGKIIRKDEARFDALRLLVYDDSYQPQKTTGLPPRWRPVNEHSSWQESPTGFRNAATAAGNDSYDWLQYENWQNTADQRSRGYAISIQDNDSYNQGETHRPLNAVTDVLFSSRLRAVGTGKLALAAVDNHDRLEVEIEPQKRAVLRFGQQTLVERKLTTNFSRRYVRLEFGLCDQQLLLVIDGRTIFRHPYQRSPGLQFSPSHSLAIGSAGLQIEFDEPRVWRDIYYLDPQGLSRQWKLGSPLATAEYALLGDNQPVSIDSRQWQPAAIPRSAILGHVYQPFWTSSKNKNL
ncbi:MAG TPA: S26 family signal peptidase [Pirellulaceae bacterium]|jgi:type IV secretory pathway protease TraF